MACGDRYKHTFVVKNWNDAGPWSKPRTWEDPWSASPGPMDYRNWKHAAERATDAMWDALEQLGQIETDLGRGWPKYNELNDAAVKIFNRRNTLPTILAFDFTGPSEEAVQIVKDASCELEAVDEAIAGYGRKTITQPADRPKGEKGGGGFGIGGLLDGVVPYLVVAGIAVGAYYLDKNSADTEEA